MIYQMYSDAIIKNGRITYFDNKLQSLCSMNVESETIEIVDIYNEAPFWASKMFEYNENIYILSWKCSNVLKYNFKQKNFELLKSPNYLNEARNKEFMYDHQFMDEHNHIRMLPRFPTRYPICSFDIENENFSSDYSLAEQLKKSYNSFQAVFSSNYEDIFNFALFNTNKWFSYCMSDKILNMYELDTDAGLSAVCFDGSRFWLTRNDSNSLLSYGNGKSDSLDCKDKASQGEAYSYICNLENHLVFIPKYGSLAVLVNKNNADVSYVNVDKFLEEEYKKDGTSKSAGCIEDENNIYILPWGIGKTIVVSKQDLSYYAINAKYDATISKLISKKGTIISEKQLHLTDYINFIKEKKDELKGEQYSCGSKIYKEITNT